MKIITITLNPAFDVHYNIENLRLYKENYATSMIKHAGGKGINISRALTYFGVKNTAYCVLGTQGADEFLGFLQNDKISYKPIIIDGKIRENITLHTDSGETRISCEGFKLKKDVLCEIYSKIECEIENDTLITFTGRLCDGITKNDAIDFLLDIKRLGAKLIVDCNSFDTEDLLKIKPFLIKPNEQEIAQLTGCEVDSKDNAFKIAKKLYFDGIENVIISLGGEGLVFYGKAGGYKVSVPKIIPVSTIGAGDSTIAGFVAAMAQGMDIEEILKLAAAFGTAACLTDGTNPPDAHTVAGLKEEIIVNKLED